MSFKICTIGCGMFASLVHGPSYKKYAQCHAGTTLGACCDLDEKKAVRFKAGFGFERYYTDFREMLDLEKPDAVCLVVAPEQTAEISVEILNRGYPLIMEKPPGLNRKEAERIAKAARDGIVPNRVAFNRRYTPLVKQLEGILSQGHRNTGIYDIQYNFHRAGRRDRDFATTAIHGIDTVKYLAGSDYRSVSFFYQEAEQDDGNTVNIYMNCVFKSGTIARISFFPFAGMSAEQAVISGYGNTFILDVPVLGSGNSSGRLLHYNGKKVILDSMGEELPGNVEGFELCGFYNENASFFDDIRANVKPAGDISSAVQSVEIADCIRNRAVEYKTVD